MTQKKTRVSGVQLAASQASSFERFSQMRGGIRGEMSEAGAREPDFKQGV